MRSGGPVEGGASAGGPAHRVEYHLRVAVVGGPQAGKRSLVRGGVGGLQGGISARRVDTGLLEGRVEIGKADAALARRWAEDANASNARGEGAASSRVSLPAGFPGCTAEVEFCVLSSKGLARAPVYAAGCASVVAVYDATSRASFEAARAWLRALWAGSHDPADEVRGGLPCVVVANKMDKVLAADGTPLVLERPPAWVGRDEGITFAHAHGCSYVETSCLRGQGVVDALREAVLAVTEDLAGVTDPIELMGRHVRVKTFAD